MNWFELILHLYLLPLNVAIVFCYMFYYAILLKKTLFLSNNGNFHLLVAKTEYFTIRSQQTG